MDNEGPLVIGAFSSLDGTNVLLRFSENWNRRPLWTPSITTWLVHLSSATLQANQADVLLGFSPAMAVGSSHQLTVANLEDLAGNPMTTTQVVVKAHVITYGCARYDLFQGLSATTVALSDLTSAPLTPFAEPDAVQEHHGVEHGG
jgi:hypothetical protein